MDASSWALAHRTATNVTVFVALSLITATLLGAVFLAEPLPATALTGLAAIVLGLWLAHRRALG